MDPEQLKFVKRAYFPTLIFQIDIPDAKPLNDSLLARIYAERDRDGKGIARSNMPALGSWHSQTDLHKQPDFADITALIGSATARIDADQGHHPDYILRIGTMWSIINPPGSGNRAHIHPASLMSGVYYIQAPENAGSIEFIEPRTAQLMNQPKYRPNVKRARENWTKVRFDPVPGRMIIFPSWLYHAVDTNMASATGDAGNRVIISFNLNQARG